MLKVFTSLVLVAALVLLGVACNGCKTTGPPPDNAEESPLLWMLRTVPPAPETRLMFNDLTALSDYQGLEIPSREASLEERVEWWKALQNYVLYGYSFPFASEIWGFSVGDVEGILTFLGITPVTVLGGGFDTAAFRRALSAQGYEEQDYLGYTVYSREAEPEDDTAKILPDAFGLIEGVEVDKGTKSLILMAGGWDYDAPESMSRVKAALAAYQDKSAIGYGSGIITSLSRSLGRVGSAYITDVLEHRSALDKLEPEQREQINLTLGPGKLDAYRGLAMTLQGYSNNVTVEFVLDYDSSATAEKNIDVLKTRLAEWRDVMYYGKARSPWEVQDVRVEGSLLRAVVKLSEDLPQMFFTGMIAYSLQYAFLFSD